LSYATIQFSIPSNALPVGITEKLALPEERQLDPIEACEKLSAEMPNPPEIQHAGDKAFYSPMTALQEGDLKGGTLQRRIRALQCLIGFNPILC